MNICISRDTLYARNRASMSCKSPNIGHKTERSLRGMRGNGTYKLMAIEPIGFNYFRRAARIASAKHAINLNTCGAKYGKTKHVDFSPVYQTINFVGQCLRNKIPYYGWELATAEQQLYIHRTQPRDLSFKRFINANEMLGIASSNN